MVHSPFPSYLDRKKQTSNQNSYPTKPGVARKSVSATKAVRREALVAVPLVEVSKTRATCDEGVDERRHDGST